jgi:hypothetical protein
MQSALFAVPAALVVGTGLLVAPTAAAVEEPTPAFRISSRIVADGTTRTVWTIDGTDFVIESPTGAEMEPVS